MKSIYCFLTRFRLSHSLQINKEFFVGVPLDFVGKLLGILHNITKDIVASRYLKLSIIALVFSLALVPVSAYQETNVSILYGYNGSDIIPVQLTPEGLIMTDINLSQSIGINPKANNTYDLGAIALAWANVYVRSIRSQGPALSLFTGGSESMTITSTGLVGINDTTPSGLLDVDVSGAADSLVVDSSGNTGVGTATPVEKLDVRGDLNVSGIVNASNFYGDGSGLTNLPSATNITGGGAANYVTKFENTTHLTQSLIYDDGTSTGVNTTTPTENVSIVGTLNITNNAGTLGLFQDGSANVGVGTASPQQKLHVVGNLNITGNLSVSGDIDGETNVSVLHGVNTSDSAQTLAAHLSPDGSLRLSISEGNSAGWIDSGTNVYLATSTDNVGLGTSTPIETLDVRGNVNISGILNVSSCVGCGGGDNDWNVSGSNVYNDTSGVKVGIGTANPDGKLHVSGGGNVYQRIETTTDNVAGLYLNSSTRDSWLITNSYSSASRLDVYDITAGAGVYIASGGTSWTANSDVRLKENIQNVSVLERLNGYRTVTFDWKNTGKHDVGVTGDSQGMESHDSLLRALPHNQRIAFEGWHRLQGSQF